MKKLLVGGGVGAAPGNLRGVGLVRNGKHGVYQKALRTREERNGIKKGEKVKCRTAKKPAKKSHQDWGGVKTRSYHPPATTKPTITGRR